MSTYPMRRRLDRLEKSGASWRAYENLPGEEWPDWALDAFIRESYPERFAGRPADDPISDEELAEIIAEAKAAEAAAEVGTQDR